MKAALCVLPRRNPRKPVEARDFFQMPAMVKKGFNRDAVDAVKQAIDAVIDPVLSEKQKDAAIQPGSEGGLRRRKPTAKKLPAKKKRSAFL